MATLTVSDNFKAAAEARAADEGFASVEAYLEALLEADARAGASAPEQLSASTREQAVALVREGLASPAREMTQADLDGMRAELIARHAAPKAG